MPAYEFTGLTPMEYPFDRDATGRPLGSVQPGDVRDLDKPLDWQWTPAGSEDEPASQDSGAAEGDAPARTRTRKAATPDETGEGEPPAS